MPEIERVPVEHYIRLLDKGIPFTLSRWGDGEWRSVLGKVRGSNCDGHPFAPGMGLKLAKLLELRPPYLMGMQRLAIRVMREPITRWLIDNRLDDMKWVDGDVFHFAAIDGKLRPFVEAVNRRRLVLAGPGHMEALKPVIRFNSFVRVPGRSAYDARLQIIAGIRKALAESKEPAVVSLSAGLPAGIILHALYKDDNGAGHTYIDMGSVWDPLVGVKSRSYMKGKMFSPLGKERS